MGKKYYPEMFVKKTKKVNLGLVHVIYGLGVGKTSRCIGLAMRAIGAGLSVAWVQFMKGAESSELKVFSLIPNLIYDCPGSHSFIVDNILEDSHYNHANEALNSAYEYSKKVQVLICDEILNALHFGVIGKEMIFKLIEICHGKVELVFSGIECSHEIIEKADYVSEIVHKKHPYYQGVKARRGIEF